MNVLLEIWYTWDHKLFSLFSFLRGLERVYPFWYTHLLLKFEVNELIHQKNIMQHKSDAYTRIFCLSFLWPNKWTTTTIMFMTLCIFVFVRMCMYLYLEIEQDDKPVFSAPIHGYTLQFTIIVLIDQYWRFFIWFVTYSSLVLLSFLLREIIVAVPSG